MDRMKIPDTACLPTFAPLGLDEGIGHSQPEEQAVDTQEEEEEEE